MNTKAIGDIGVNATIGILAKYGLGVCFPLSDNYPFDIIIVRGNKLFRAQVKASSASHSEGSIAFNFETNNYYSGTRKKYSSEECDIMLGYDLLRDKLFIFPSGSNYNSISLRVENDIIQNSSNLAKDYEVSAERIKSILNFDCPNIKDFYAKQKERIDNKPKKEHTIKCKNCEEDFKSYLKFTKYCSNKCKEEYRFKVPHPSKEELEKLVWEKPMTYLSKKFGVSDKTIKKWCIKENIKTPIQGYWQKKESVNE